MAVRELTLRVLAENTTHSGELLAEHGLAVWIEADGHRMLFDTGQGKVLLENARLLGIPLALANAIILSHGHYDHTGGLATVLGRGVRHDVFLHPAALESKFARGEDGRPRNIGIPFLTEDAIRQRVRHLVFTQRPTELRQGILVTGEIPRITEFEDTGGPFYLDEQCTRPDPLWDDQAVILDPPQGLVVVVGCAHSGIVNTLRYAAKLTGKDHVHAVIGGLHLVGASRERVEQTIEAFRELDVQRVGLAHCTGIDAIVEFWKAFPGRCFLCPVSTRVGF